MKSISLSAVLLLLTFAQVNLMAQTAPTDSTAKKELKELKFKLNQDGSHYVKATFTNQIWLRYNQQNPGTTLDGYTLKDGIDIGLRRTRIQLFGQVSDRVFFYTQIGTNNLSSTGARKQGLFFHDAVAELKVWKEHLSLGMGLTGWSGLSRYASPSIASILSLDAPLYQQATNDVTDQFLRKYSVYAKGKFGGFDYRLAVTKPMAVSNSTAQSTQISTNAKFSPEPAQLQYQGYFMYQFWDKESNLTPYMTGSYLGKKRVLNLGAGFIFQKNAMWYSQNNGLDTIHSNLALFAADVFFDQPINKEKGTAITAYGSFSSNNYGKNYVRNLGVMNPANGTDANGSYNGAGDALPLMGTGTTAYLQVGYLLKQNLLGKLGTLQFYGASQYSNFDLLKDPMLMYELGANWLLEQHRYKISFNYQNRPIYTLNSAGDWKATDRKAMFVLQFQIAI
jgi:hypothetical protein